MATRSERDKRIAAMAYLVGAQGLSEKQARAVIETRYGHYSSSTASRDCAEARRRQWLIERFADESFSDDGELLEELSTLAHRYSELETVLAAKSQRVLKGLRVVYGGVDQASACGGPIQDALTECGRRSAHELYALLIRSKVLGVASGHTLRAACDGVAARASFARASDRADVVHVIPTSGEPIGAGAVDTNSTSLASLLSQALNRRRVPVPSLAGVPSVIPRKYQAERREIVLEFIADLRAYRDIFVGRAGADDPRPWIERLDSILTCAGAFGSWQAYDNELTRTVGIGSDELAEVADGDIGGVLIPRPSLSARKRQRFDEIARLWTGMQLGDYRRIAHAAELKRTSGSAGPPGVIVCAFGANKARIVDVLVTRTRVVNHLLIDHALADALAEIHRLGKPGTYQRLGRRPERGTGTAAGRRGAVQIGHHGRESWRHAGVGDD